MMSDTDANCAMPLVLLTGASRGIGAAAAREFVASGWHVIAVSRRAAALEKMVDELPNAHQRQVTIAPLNLADTDGIERLSKAVAKRWGRLDALVGNAGVLGTLSPTTHLSSKVWHEVMAVNLNANWHLLRHFDPLLKKSPNPRALFVSSGMAVGHCAYWSAYATSKAALETMVSIYAIESKVNNVVANVLNPGIVATRMRATAMPGEDPSTLPQPSDLAETVVRLVSPETTFTAQRARFLGGEVELEPITRDGRQPPPRHPAAPQ